MDLYPRLYAGLCAAALTTLAYLYALKAWRRLRKSRAPVSDRLLRPPGESLRLRIDDLGEKLCLAVVAAVLSPVLASLSFSRLHVLLVFAIAVVAFIPVVFIARKHRRYVLGYSGERAVGEELNQLMRHGCHVFHDFPASPDWNIDHIVVAPTGVFDIETKTRRKRRAPKGRKDHEIVYDGKTLQFPHSQDTHALDQVRRSAAWLSRELTVATGERESIPVKPILTFPGWYITSKAKDGVMVVNPKQLRSVILSGKTTLSEAQCKRIAHQIEQRCRDVEF